MVDEVVGRLAPTPSGRMHLGNVMAMLAAWMSARSEGGRVLLRIEDLDRARVVRDADRWIMDDLTWLGIDWDGEPAYQSDREGLYEKALEGLESVDSVTTAERPDPLAGYAASGVYPCWCSRSDIRAASAPQEGDGFVVYPGTCRRLLEDYPGEVRARLVSGRRHSLRLATPRPGGESNGASEDVVLVPDRVFGDVHYSLSRDVGDSVLRRADGVFSYQLAVVVDDVDMGVTDVVRGRDLLRSTALQMEIRRRLRLARAAGRDDGWDADRDVGCSVDIESPAWDPRYAHLPLLDGPGGRRLAKRERSLDMGALRDAGLSARQIVGYCLWLLGMGCGRGRVNRPVPMSAAEGMGTFSWRKLAADRGDRVLPEDVVETIRHV